MATKWTSSGLAAAATVLAASLPVAAVAVTGADFDREANRIATELQRDRIMIDLNAQSALPAQGAAGRSAEDVMGAHQGADQATWVDSGSAWFNRYVEDVNRQLHLREQESIQ